MSASARDGVGSPEAFALRPARHVAGAYDWITGTRVAVDAFGWDRIAVGGQPNEHDPPPRRRRGADGVHSTADRPHGPV